MATKQVLIVFVLPVIFSLAFGSAVLFDILQQPDRELSIGSTSYSGEEVSRNYPIEIIGLSKQYTTLEPVEIQVKINDSSFNCGDLYVTIYSANNDAVTQGGFFEQCYESENKLIPVGEQFSKVIDTPGSYEIDVQIVSKQLKNISAKGTFTVK